ncbi:tryptophan--tRNA ligase [Candidatus Dependentiae bacterium]|nr:tryptophan--tRNA ligase [Candidatus Dependentiae bacterium]
MSEKKIILTGDRPTGKLHLGHFVGSLQNRVKLQSTHKQFVMIADQQALTDNADNPQKIINAIFEVLLDYLSVGIDPKQTTIFAQSGIPQISELAFYYLNLVTVARLSRNPTIKDEIRQRGFEESIPAGFLVYPVHQAADITIVNAQLVPVGADQLPMIEQTNEIVRSFNRIYGETFNEVEALIPEKCNRLMGTDGQEKMGKSLGNAIYLADDADTVYKKVMGMYTDPNHLRASDPGKVEGNPVFTYLDVFGSDLVKIQEMKDHYTRGGLGDVIVKKYLNEVLQAFLEPIRARRAEVNGNQDYLHQILKQGTQDVRTIAEQTIKKVKTRIGLTYI